MPAKKPNILILWGDDIGIWNISKFSNGMMGYRTPNIDRVANEGGLFTDYYSQQSCTAGRACFIAGQNPIRTGLTKVGMPGATVGLQTEDPTIAEMLKPLGYATGQFGKNHLGDRNEFLPTVHGFDEFFGNLYHLNAEEEPELPDYPEGSEVQSNVRAAGRAALQSNRQRRRDRRPSLGTRRKANDRRHRSAHQEAHGDHRRGDHRAALSRGWRSRPRPNKPFFLWYNSTAMHFRTHVAEKNLGKSGQDPYSDRMVVHDEQIGMMLDKLDELGIADNTIVMYSTDNGPENDTWPDGANTPFRGQKDSNWEGGWRVPCFIRWPGTIKPGSVYNGIVSHIDMFPTLLAAAGNPDVTKQLLDGCTVGGKKFNVHLDGYNMIPYFSAARRRKARETPSCTSATTATSSRCGSATGSSILSVQRANQMNQWAEPFVKLRLAAYHELAARSVRAGRLQLEHLLGLDGRSRAPAVHDAGGRGAADRGLRQVPAAAETGVVQPGLGDGTGENAARLTTHRRAFPYRVE